MIADDLKPLWCIYRDGGFLRSALCASLRRHHIALVVKFLVLFGKEKDLLALHAWDLNIGHFAYLRAASLTVDVADSTTWFRVCYSHSSGFIFECNMPQQVQWYRWDEMPLENVTEQLDRRIITGERMMLTHVYLKKGCIVPQHSHDNEQLTYILEGALKFWIGENGEEELTVRAGEVLVIPSNVKHKAEALEDTLDVDVFCPPRQDWLNKTDDYLRK